MEVDFLETKGKVILYVYTSKFEKSDVKLVNKKKLSLGDDVCIDLYKEVKKILSTKKYPKRLEIELEKEELVTWYTLNGPEEKKTVPKDVKDEIKDDESDNEEKMSAMDLMAKIYHSSDEDVRKAMEKSFIESEGTVLSTDWSEVKDKKVVPKK